MERRKAILHSVGIAGLSILSVNNSFAQGKKNPRFGDSIIPPDKEAGKEKHVPFIDAPQKAKAGAPFIVTVEVGKVVPHPNTVEHHISWIQLYSQEDGSPYVLNIGTFEFGPTYASPKVTLPVMLQKSSTLFALGFCNIHGVWDNSLKVEIEG